MECPKCNTHNDDESIECFNCGIVFAKYSAIQERKRRESEEQAATELESVANNTNANIDLKRIIVFSGVVASIAIIVYLIFNYLNNHEVLTSELNDRNGVYYLVNSDSPFSGLAASYHSNGQIMKRIDISNGKIYGRSEIWYANGQLEVQANYIEGQLDGVFNKWYENGQIELRVQYRGGILSGLGEQWYESGQLQKRINYKYGSFDGLTEEWYENGNTKTRIVYKDGIRHGLAEQWFEDGNVQTKVIFDNDSVQEVIERNYRKGDDPFGLGKYYQHLTSDKTLSTDTILGKGQALCNSFVDIRQLTKGEAGIQEELFVNKSCITSPGNTKYEILDYVKRDIDIAGGGFVKIRIYLSKKHFDVWTQAWSVSMSKLRQWEKR